MVQILPPKTNLGSQLGQALGQGLAGGFQRGSEVGLQQHYQNLQNQQQSQQRMASAGHLANQLFGPGESQQKNSLISALSNLDPADQIKGVQKLAEAQILNQYLSSQQSGAQGGSPASGGQPSSQSTPIPAIGALAPLAQQQQEQIKQAQKEREFGHTKTEKFSEKLAADATQGEEMKYGIRLIRDAMKSGRTGPTARNLAQKYLEGAKSPLADLFASPASGKINVGIKTLAGGFKQIMGSKPTEREFFWYENILPSLVKNIETNEAIVDYFDKVSDFSLKAQEESDQIIKENGGYRPIDLDVRVREKMRPLFNNLISEGMGLLGESESPSPKKEASSPTVFTEFPDAKSYKGRILRDPDSGKRYQSDGINWIEVQ